MVLGPDEQRHRVLIPHCLAVTELNERTYCTVVDVVYKA